MRYRRREVAPLSSSSAMMLESCPIASRCFVSSVVNPQVIRRNLKRIASKASPSPAVFHQARRTVATPTAVNGGEQSSTTTSWSAWEVLAVSFVAFVTSASVIVKYPPTQNEPSVDMAPPPAEQHQRIAIVHREPMIRSSPALKNGSSSSSVLTTTTAAVLPTKQEPEIAVPNGKNMYDVSIHLG